MSSITLVKPPEKSYFNFGTFSLIVLAAAVRDIADIKIIDCTSDSISDAVNKVISENSDYIGITIMGLSSVKGGNIFISALKKQFREGNTTDTPIIVGGHGATMSPESLLKAGADIVVCGEGENTLRQILADGITENIAGTIQLKNGSLKKAPRRNLITSLDDLRMPSYGMMLPPQDGVYLLETSRGCPHNCKFCETTRFSGKKWRPKSTEKVEREVHFLVNEIGARIVQIADDNFTANPDRATNLCKKLQKGPLPILFLASARADDLISEPELIPAMAKANFFRVTIGVETLDSSLAKSIGKSISVDTYKKAFKTLKDNCIFSTASFIVGLPGETKRIRERMVDMAIELGPDAAHFIPFTPHPNTPFAKDVVEYFPNEEDVIDSEKFSKSFRENPTNIKSLKNATLNEDMRGVFAQAILDKIYS